MTKKILALISLVIAVALFLLYTRPAYDQVRALNEKVSEYDDALAKAAELQRRKQTLLSRYNSMDPVGIDRLKKLLPDHVDNVRLILDLDTMASRHGMTLENVAVGEKNSDSESKTAAGIIGGTHQKYDSINIRFSTSGTYKDFTAFLSDLESSLRIVDVTDLKLESSGANRGTSDEQGSGDPVYRFSISMRTYWLK